MPEMNLKRVYTVYDKEKAPHQFGPGPTDVPDEYVERLKLRGAEVKAPAVQQQSDDGAAGQSADAPPSALAPPVLSEGKAEAKTGGAKTSG